MTEAEKVELIASLIYVFGNWPRPGKRQRIDPEDAVESANIALMLIRSVTDPPPSPTEVLFMLLEKNGKVNPRKQ